MPIVWAILHFTCAFVLMFSANWLGLISWRRRAAAHWSERARLLWPVRCTAGLNIFLLPVFLLLGHELLFSQSYPLLWVNGFAGFFGSLLGCYPLDHEIFPALDFRSWCHQVVVAWGFRFGTLIVFFSAMLLMPKQGGWAMLPAAGGYLIIHFLIQYGLFLKYLRLVKFVRPADPRLRQIVAGLAERTGVTVRAIWQNGGIAANAFAFVTTHELMFSDRLLEICDDQEVAAICSHELAHLTESKRVLAGRLIGSLMLFPLIFVIPVVTNWGIGGVLVLYAAMFLMAFFSRKLAHRMEKRADEVAAREQTNEGVYARALEKIYQANQMPAVHAGKKVIHPHLYDRIVAAGITPDYPRPVKPKKATLVGWVLLGGVVVLSLVKFCLISH